MNEPKHSHFVLADASYCHVLEDKLYIGKRELPEKFPLPTYKLDFLTLTFQLLGLLVLSFFIVMTLMTKFYVITFTLSLFTITLALATLRSAGFTNTFNIPIASIVKVDYTKKSFGYDFFVIHYYDKIGKIWKRRLAIYDSKICLDQAIAAMKDAKLLK